MGALDRLCKFVQSSVKAQQFDRAIQNDGGDQLHIVVTDASAERAMRFDEIKREAMASVHDRREFSELLYRVCSVGQVAHGQLAEHDGVHDDRFLLDEYRDSRIRASVVRDPR